MSEQSDYREISDAAVMAERPLVTVHMLAYRHEKFLTEAINGVIKQECDFTFELIIAEDCSPDGTLAIAIEYQRRYPQLIRLVSGEKNVGMQTNALRSLSLARGKYAAFCEGDDFWHHPGKLQMQVDAMSTSDKITLCHTDYDRQVRNGLRRAQHRTTNPRYLANGDTAYEALLHQWTVITVTAMYRKDVLDAFVTSQFREERWPFGDYNLALFAAANGRVIYLPLSTATWRKVSGSATNDTVDAYLEMAIAYEDCRERFLSAYPVPDSVALMVRTESQVRIMNRAFWAGRKDVFDACEDWLVEHGRKRLIPWRVLRSLILRSKLLTAAAQHFRTIVRSTRLIGR